MKLDMKGVKWTRTIVMESRYVHRDAGSFGHDERRTLSLNVRDSDRGIFRYTLGYTVHRWAHT